MRQLIGLLALGLCLGVAPVASAQSFVAFESGPVRPLASSPDGSLIFATNTPANRLEVFAVAGRTLRQLHSVPVGLEPVAVAARSNTEVWVVNHLSDSVDVVDLSLSPPRVVRTLHVGDEPRDIVFAGTGGSRAFITTAHRGQNGGFDPQLSTPHVPRADVWVYDANNPGDSTGGNALGRVSLFGDTPRALAASPDGQSVYAAVFHSGNRTTAVNEGVADFVFSLGIVQPVPPFDNVDGVPAPATGVILKHDGTSWRDAMGQNWANSPMFTLPDYDVFKLDANAAPGTMASTATRYSGVGTILYSMVVGATNKVYVSNTEAFNQVRFEGPGTYAASQGAPTPTTLRGHLHESRITVIDDPNVTPIHLNPHIDYSQAPVAPGTKDKSLAIPLQLALSGDGSTLYVAAFGSSKVGIFDVAELEAGSFVPDPSDHIEVSGGGPAGLVLDETRNRLYVYTRFDDAISIVDLTGRREIGKVALHNPEPPSIVDGRPFLYDARISSDRGDSSCAVCHVFSRMDDLAWNLGNPDGSTVPNTNPLLFPLSLLVEADPPTLTPAEAAALMNFHPMKGPMTTQTLKGMVNHGPMHWRGDRTPSDPNLFLDTDLAFKEFNVAFDGLLGGQTLSSAEMQAYTDFILQVMLPPNPVRNLDNSLTPAQQAGRDFWFNTPTAPAAAPVLTCNNCHVLDPAQGFFGADGITTFDGETQLFKVAHMRNLYQKVGKFGLLGTSPASMGDQIRGYGLLHDGSVDTLVNFVGGAAFFFPSAAMRQNMVEFLLAFDSDIAPIVGQQLTRHSGNASDPGTTARIALLEERAGLTTPEADLVVRGMVSGERRSWVMTSPDTFRSDKSAEPTVTGAGLIALAGSDELTFLSVPPGSGARFGIDQDEDTVLDGDDNCRWFQNLGQADADSDGTGDACECADQSGDGLITQADTAGIESCLEGLVACSGLCDGTHDDHCDAGDVTAVQLALLSKGELRCARNPIP